MKPINIIIEELITKSDLMEYKYPTWRKGQTFFNTLHIEYPDIADQIRGTKNDPFYNDNLIEACIEQIKTLL